MDYIAEPLRSLAVPIAELHEDPSNARKGHAVERIAASLKQYGQRKPIVVNRAQGGKVEAGNGTLAAAKSLGWTHIAAVFVDDDAATAAAYGIADNRVGEFSEWDADILGDLIPTLDWLFTGFLPAELDAILPQQHTEGDTEPQVDRADELRQKWGVESGQMWRLGEHRIICGDCTDAVVVARVMGGEKAALCFTSPPYNAGKTPTEEKLGTERKYKDYSDDLTQDGYLDLLVGFTDIALSVCEFTFVNLQMLSGNKLAILDYMTHYRMNLADIAIWDKQHAQPAMAENVMNSRFEFLFAFSSASPASRRLPGSFRGTVDNVYAGSPQRTNDLGAKVHAATMPVDFAAWVVSSFTDGRAIAYEPFSGSGTTIIACENLGRKCRAVEISPAYVAVAIERWATHTGVTPELLP